MIHPRKSLVFLALCLCTLLCTAFSAHLIVLNKVNFLIKASTTTLPFVSVYGAAQKKARASHQQCFQALENARMNPHEESRIRAHSISMETARALGQRLRAATQQFLNHPTVRNWFTFGGWQIHGLWLDPGPHDTCFSDPRQPALTPAVTDNDFAFADPKKGGILSAVNIREQLSDLTNSQVTFNFVDGQSETFKNLATFTNAHLFTSHPSLKRPNILVFSEWVKHGRYLPSNIALASGGKLMRLPSAVHIVRAIIGPIREYAGIALSLYPDAAALCDRALRLNNLPTSSDDPIHFKGSGDCRVRVLFDSATNRYFVDTEGIKAFLTSLEAAQNAQKTLPPSPKSGLFLALHNRVRGSEGVLAP